MPLSIIQQDIGLASWNCVRTDITPSMTSVITSIVTPTTSLALCKRIFGLAVESHEAHLGIKLIIVKRRGHVKADGSTLGCGDVLHRVQREHGNVGLRTRAAAAGRQGRGYESTGKDDFSFSLVYFSVNIRHCAFTGSVEYDEKFY